MHFRNDAGADPRPAASIRPADEIHRLSVHLTIVRWRLVQYLGMGTRQMAFEEYLRSHPMFSERWLDDIAFVDGDLAIDGCAIGEADEDLVVHFNSRAMERQIAAYWLEGDGDGVYADVTPSTLLSACGEPETYARLQQEAEGEEQAAEQRLADQRRGAEETLAAAAAGGEAADGAGLVAALEAIEPKLLRFQKVFLEDFRRQVNAGGDTPQLRAKALEILQARQA